MVSHQKRPTPDIWLRRRRSTAALDACSSAEFIGSHRRLAHCSHPCCLLARHLARHIVATHFQQPPLQ